MISLGLFKHSRDPKDGSPRFVPLQSGKIEMSVRWTPKTLFLPGSKEGHSPPHPNSADKLSGDGAPSDGVS